MVVIIKKKTPTFEECYEAHYAEAVKYTVKKVSHKENAEDLVMEAFAACLKHFDKFDPQRAKFATWYYFVLNNKIKNYYRNHKELEPLEDYPELPGTGEDEMASAVQVKEWRDMLALALKELPELQRRIVILSYFHSKNSNEIAAKCGMTPGNVRVQLSRALKKIQTFFEKNNMEWDI